MNRLFVGIHQYCSDKIRIEFGGYRELLIVRAHIITNHALFVHLASF